MDEQLQPTTPIVEPAIPENTNSVPAKRHGILTPLLFVLLIISFGVIGFFVHQNWQLTQQISQAQPTPTPLVTQSPTPDPTVNWKTYTNINTGYSLKYPSTWHVTENPKPLGVGEVSDTKWNLSDTNDLPNVQILVFTSNSNYVKSITPSGGTTTVIDGVSAIKYTSEAQTFGISYQVAHGMNRYFINLELSSSQDESRYDVCLADGLSHEKLVVHF